MMSSVMPAAPMPTDQPVGALEVIATAFLILSAAMMSDSFYPLSLGLMLIIALASASHDIACDGYYMMALDNRQQSFFVGIRSTYLVLCTGILTT